MFGLALAHCDGAVAVGALGGAPRGGGAPLASAPPCGEPVALRGVPLPPGALEAGGGGYAPLGDGSRLNLVSCLASLRGEVLIACENRARAAQWLLAALRIDPHNVQAYSVRVVCAVCRVLPCVLRSAWRRARAVRTFTHAALLHLFPAPCAACPAHHPHPHPHPHPAPARRR